jgi:hypothetical protein
LSISCCSTNLRISIGDGKLLQYIFIYFFYHRAKAPPPPVGQGLLIHEVSRSGRVISLSQIPLPDNTQYSQQTNIHSPGEIRTNNPRKREAAEPRLRPRDHWNRHCIALRSPEIRLLSVLCQHVFIACHFKLTQTIIKCDQIIGPQLAKSSFITEDRV